MKTQQQKLKEDTKTKVIWAHRIKSYMRTPNQNL